MRLLGNIAKPGELDLEVFDIVAIFCDGPA